MSEAVERLIDEGRFWAKVCDQVGLENKDGREMPSAQIAAWCKLIADLCAERIRAITDDGQAN